MFRLYKVAIIRVYILEFKKESYISVALHIMIKINGRNVGLT